jgi:hypothetical protein
MLKALLNNDSFMTRNIKNTKIRKQLTLNKTLTPIKLLQYNPKNKYLVYNKKEENKNDISMINRNKKIKNSRNINLNTDYNNLTYNSNSIMNATTYIKTTMDTNITKKEKENNSSFINDNTFLCFSPSTNYQSSNIKNKSKKTIIKIPKSNGYTLNKKNKNINNTFTFILPNRLNTLINVEQNILKPMKQKSKINYKNSIRLNKKVNNIKEKINLINMRRKSLDDKKLLIKKTKLKNLSKLFEYKIESINNIEDIKKVKNKEIENINNKINKIKKDTSIININKKRIKEELIKNKNEILNYEKLIEKIDNDKKKVNSMLISLHKRIIDIKNRIKKNNENNLYLDKSFYELSQKYKNFI